MLRRPYTVNTTLAQPLSRRASELVLLDSSNLTLYDGDWCYLKLEEYGKVEIVKAYQKIGDTLLVVRGLDNTIPQDFFSATVTYTITKEEIKEALPSIDSLQVKTEGVFTYENNTLHVDPLVVGFKYVHYSFGKDGVVAIGRQENAYGCCGADNGIGGFGYGIFYLTSLLYPVELIDAFNVDASVTGTELREFVTEADAADNLNVAPISITVDMRAILEEYSYREDLDVVASVDVELKTLLLETYADDSLNVQPFSVDIVLERKLVENETAEQLNVYGALQGITLA